MYVHPGWSNTQILHNNYPKYCYYEKINSQFKSFHNVSRKIHPEQNVTYSKLMVKPWGNPIYGHLGWANGSDWEVISIIPIFGDISDQN